MIVWNLDFSLTYFKGIFAIIDLWGRKGLSSRAPFFSNFFLKTAELSRVKAPSSKIDLYYTRPTGGSSPKAGCVGQVKAVPLAIGITQ